MATSRGDYSKASGAYGGGSGGEFRPVDRVVPSNKFRHHADPLEPGPQVLGPVGTQDMQRVLESEHREIIASKGQARESLGHARQGQWKMKPNGGARYGAGEVCDDAIERTVSGIDEDAGRCVEILETYEDVEV